jgi:hypothetical protein
MRSAFEQRSVFERSCVDEQSVRILACRESFADVSRTESKHDWCDTRNYLERGEEGRGGKSKEKRDRQGVMCDVCVVECVCVCVCVMRIQSEKMNLTTFLEFSKAMSKQSASFQAQWSY